MLSLPSLKKPERWKYASLSQQESTAVELTEAASMSTERRLSKDGYQKHALPPAKNTLPNNFINSISTAYDVASERTEHSLYDSTLVDNDPDTWDSDEPTQAERQTLRKVPDKLPASAFLVAVVELCERFAYYGMSGPFQNYISNKYHDPSGNPGAIGMDQTGATALTNFFQFWCYLTPILGAVCADQWLGKYKTIVLFSVFYLVGLLILFLTSLPVAIENGYALGGLIAAMVVIGLGTGGIKSNVSPLIAEQYQETKMRVKILPSGEKVIVDPALTIQRIYMIFYLCINTGSLSAIATTEMELNIGFWSAYLLPLIMFCIGFGVLVAGKKKYVVRPPKGSVIMDSFKALWIGMRSKDGLDAAKSSYPKRNPAKSVPWNDSFVEELRRALVACKVFLFFPVYWCVYNQMLNNFVSQAGTMELHGIPNDIMQNIDPITVILFIPVFDRLVYPSLRKAGIQFKPITRITWGFLMGSIAMAYAAIVQNWIYNAGPCFKTPLKCAAGRLAGGKFEHNHVHVAYQTPAYFFIALSEIFASITGLEYAYTKAPPNMKSFIMSMFLLTNAGGALLGMAISPVAKDPNLVWLYTGLSGGSVVAAVVFWALFNHYNTIEDSMNELNVHGDRPISMNDMPQLPLVNKVSNFNMRALMKSGESDERNGGHG